MATETYKTTPFSDFLIFGFAFWRDFANKKSPELVCLFCRAAAAVVVADYKTIRLLSLLVSFKVLCLRSSISLVSLSLGFRFDKEFVVVFFFFGF